MQNEGWKCLECGVVYAPFVKECRCSAKTTTNEGSLVCFHNWPDYVSPCTKCGVRMTTPIPFTFNPTVDISGCMHIYPDSNLTTAGRFCSLCGMQEVKWDREKDLTSGGTNG